MFKISVEVEGMKCPMCEKHTNEAIEKNLQVKKVVSYHKENKTEITSDADISDDKIREAIAETGYTIGAITHEEIKEKKSLFNLLSLKRK